MRRSAKAAAQLLATSTECARPGTCRANLTLSRWAKTLPFETPYQSHPSQPSLFPYQKPRAGLMSCTAHNADGSAKAKVARPSEKQDRPIAKNTTRSAITQRRLSITYLDQQGGDCDETHTRAAMARNAQARPVINARLRHVRQERHGVPSGRSGSYYAAI